MKETDPNHSDGSKVPTSSRFNCSVDIDGEHATWVGDWQLMFYCTESGSRLAELEVNGRFSYFYVIIGEYYYGHFLAIPNWQVGCELSFKLTDTFWNYEKLSRYLPPVDCTTVIMGIKDFALKSGWVVHDKMRLNRRLSHRNAVLVLHNDDTFPPGFEP